ncbi:MAG: ABC transporter ATP-binding protein [Anaerolineae bacterium]|nr:ABC transporter ATP-binding protein [Anaerolineales bacterium]MCQ3979839.1 ABC transporter ATP-binding protein [Anaerolineae bacterium]
MTQVNLIHLSKIYEGTDVPALQDLSLELASGRITAVLGPSGCGKTTLLKLIAGLLYPSQGDIIFDGQSVLPIPAERRGAVMVFQNHLLFPYLSVAENVGFGLKMQGVDRQTIRRRVAEMLGLVQLPGYEERRPRQLSGGQQQRVALARALIVQPRVLLLDEPLSNLDAHLRNDMQDLILEVQRRLGLTTIIVTHDQVTATTLADQIGLMFDGRLHQFGRPQAFYERPVSVRVARFFGGANFVPGIKHEAQVETALGIFHCPAAASHPDGPVTLTIRPEHLQLSQNGIRQNGVEATVQSCLYLGLNTRFKVQTAQTLIPLEIVTSTTHLEQFSKGQRVTLHFPPDKIWLTPPEQPK